MEKYVFKNLVTVGSRPNTYCCSATNKYEAITILIGMVIRPSVEFDRYTRWNVFRYADNGDLVEDVCCFWNELCIWATC